MVSVTATQYLVVVLATTRYYSPALTAACYCSSLLSVTTKYYSLKAAPLLHFASLRPSELQLRFPPAKQRAFDESIKPLGGGWCCVDPPTRGAPMHYWYDALFDQPHTDRWGRKWTADRPWTPSPGP